MVWLYRLSLACLYKVEEQKEIGVIFAIVEILQKKKTRGKIIGRNFLSINNNFYIKTRVFL
jgi:hypothetical protein